MANNRLSKSTFIRGLQCEKSLYLYKHHYRLKDPTPSSLQAVFDQGTNIGLLAQELFPYGAVISELIEIEEKLEDFKIKISNLDKKVSELIEFSKNLSNIWVSGEYETKLSVQKLLFPEGIVIDPEDRTYRTSNLNPIFGLIHSFTGGNDSGNKKRTSKNTSPSRVVGGSRIEPAD